MISLIFHPIQISTSIENHTVQEADLQSMTLQNYTVFPVIGNEAKDDALIILRTFLLLRERLEDSHAIISEKDIANKEDRDSFFRIINWIDTEYCSRSTNLIARTEGSHSVSYMTINYDEIRTRISKWIKKECTYVRVSYDEEYRLHIFTGIQSEDEMNSHTQYQHMTIIPVPEHMNNMLHRKDISRKDIFSKAEKRLDFTESTKKNH